MLAETDLLSSRSIFESVKTSTVVLTSSLTELALSAAACALLTKIVPSAAVGLTVASIVKLTLPAGAMWPRAKASVLSSRKSGLKQFKG